MQNPHRWLCLVFVSRSLFDQDQGFSQQLRTRKSRFNRKRKPNFSLVALQWRDIKLSGKLLVVKSRKCDCFSRRKSIQSDRVFMKSSNMNTIIHVFFWRRIKDFFCIGSLFLLHGITMLLILTFGLRKKLVIPLVTKHSLENIRWWGGFWFTALYKDLVKLNLSKPFVKYE